MIKQYGFSTILSEEECLNEIKKLDSLEDNWIKRTIGSSYYYTFGPFTHLDAVDKDSNTYQEIKDKTNHIMLESFSSLYLKVISSLENIVGPCIYEEDLSLPSFHIFGKKKTEKYEIKLSKNIGLATGIHQDKQCYYHDRIWSKYKKVEKENILSFTLPLELQKNGGGMAVWGEDNFDIDSESDYANEMKSYTNAFDDPHSYNLKETLGNQKPKIVEYEIGKMFYFVGDPFHQILFSNNSMNNERRITLQGHAIKCDGIWRVHV